MIYFANTKPTQFVRGLSFIALCLVAWLSGMTAVAAQTESSTDVYWALVDRSIDQLEQDDVTEADVAWLVTQWQAFDDSGGLFRPLLIVEQLQTGSAQSDIDAHLAMFYALQESRETWPQNRPAAEQEGQDLASFLGQEKYRYDTDPQDDNALSRFFRNAWDMATGWIDRFFAARDERTPETAPRSGPILSEADPLIGVTGIASAFVLVLILLMLLQRVRPGWNQEIVKLEDDNELLERLTVADAMEKAEETADSGDYRHSVRYLYLSTLLILEEKGYLKTDRSLTNQEYLQVMSPYPRRATVLRDVVQIFDRVWYGNAPIDQETLHFYQERIRELQQDEESNT